MMKYSLENTIECLLLVSDEPMSLSSLIKILDDDSITKKQIEKSIDNLNQEYRNKAIHINKVASGYRFQAKNGLEAYITKLKDKGTNKFSKAFLETTAIIAYKQPVTRGDIEEIRGIAVNSNIIRTLLELEWIKVVGHKESPGKPELFGTTTKFLDYFNKNKLSDLPEISDVESI
jgi:segregation and condensation protein B